MFSALISYSFIQYTSAGWRSCYAFCIAVEGAATVALFLFYYPPSFATKHLLDKKSRWQLVMETDFVGLFTFSAACTLLLLAINWVSRTLPVPRLKTLSNTGRCAASMEECCSDCSYRGLWCTLYLPWLLGGICRLITPTSACAAVPQIPRVGVLKTSLSLSFNANDQLQLHGHSRCCLRGWNALLFQLNNLATLDFANLDPSRRHHETRAVCKYFQFNYALGGTLWYSCDALGKPRTMAGYWVSNHTNGVYWRSSECRSPYARHDYLLPSVRWNCSYRYQHHGFRYSVATARRSNRYVRESRVI